MKYMVIFPFVVALTGCAAVGPEYQRPKLSLAPSYAGQPQGTTPAELQAAWWTQYGDPLLTELITTGLSRNLDVQSAEAYVRQAKANLRATGINATMSGDLTASETHSRNASDSSSQSLSADFVIDLFGGIRREREAAKADLDAAQADVETARLSWLAEVIAAYSDARYYQAALAMTRETIRSRQKTTDITQRQLDAGDATEYELAEAKALLDTARADLPYYQALFRANVFALAALMDTPADPLMHRMQKGAPQLRTPGAIKVGVPADLLRNRPDLRSEESSLRAAVADIGVAEADLLPSITLSGSLGNTDGSQSWSFGPELSLPIFNQGALAANRDAKIAAAEAAEISWRSTVNDAVEDVQVAASNLIQYRKRQVALARAANSYDYALRLAQQNYEAGATTLLDLLDTDRSAASARISAASAANDAAQEWAVLQISLGAGSH